MSIGAIDPSRIEAMVAQLRAAAAQAAPPGDGPVRAGEAAPGGTVDFSAALKSSLDQINQMQKQSSELGERFALGDTSVSLSDAMLSMQKAGIAMQQAIQVRNRLVQAYQDIMNMGI